MVGGTGKKKKKAFIRTVKRNFLTNNINHMLCIYDESRVGSVKKYRERLYTFLLRNKKKNVKISSHSEITSSDIYNTSPHRVSEIRRKSITRE